MKNQALIPSKDKSKKRVQVANLTDQLTETLTLRDGEC